MRYDTEEGQFCQVPRDFRSVCISGRALDVETGDGFAPVLLMRNAIYRDVTMSLKFGVCHS